MKTQRWTQRYPWCIIVQISNFSGKEGLDDEKITSGRVSHRGGRGINRFGLQVRTGKRSVGGKLDGIKTTKRVKGLGQEGHKSMMETPGHQRLEYIKRTYLHFLFRLFGKWRGGNRKRWVEVDCIYILTTDTIDCSYKILSCLNQNYVTTYSHVPYIFHELFLNNLIYLFHPSRTQ